MSLSKPEFHSQHFSERFDLKLFLSLDLIRTGRPLAKRSAWATLRPTTASS